MKDQDRIPPGTLGPIEVRSGAEDQDEIDLLALARTLWRGKWLIAGFALLACLIAGYHAFVVATPKYRATASLVLDVRGANVLDLAQVVSGISTDTAALNTELEVIRSRTLIGRLVDEQNLVEDPEFNPVLRPPETSVLSSALDWAEGEVRELLERPAAPAPPPPSPEEIRQVTIDSVRGAISASGQRDTYVTQISATTEVPEKSVRLANALADIYVRSQIEGKFATTERAVDWLSDQVRELEVELREKEDALKAFRADAELVQPEGLDVFNLQAREQRDRVERAEASVRDLEARLAILLAAEPEGDLSQLVSEVEDPVLARLAEMVDGGTDVDANAVAARIDRLIAETEVSLERARTQATGLRSALARLESEVAKQSAALVELQQLERETEATRVLYETVLTRLKETTITRGLQEADSEVLSEAQWATLVEPRRKRMLALAGIVGILLGAGLVLGREALKTQFRSAEALEHFTGLTVLGEIPLIPVRRRSKIVPYLDAKPTSAAAEAVRNLRTSILMSNVDHPPQVIMTTSAIPGEGKTTLAVAVAHNLAGLGRRVLLIEGDMRRRVFGEYLQSTPKLNILSILTGDATLVEAVHHDDALGVDVLVAGRSKVSAADLFASERFRDLIEVARSGYDIIIIDTPPVLVVPDARVIGQHADCIVFSVGWDKTSRSQVADGLRQLQTLRLPVSGLVLSQVDPRRMRRYGYGERYGAYAKYGRRYYGTR